MKTSSDYKNASLGCLRGNWAPAVLATAVYLLIALSVYSGNNIDGFSKILPKLAFFNGASAALKLVLGGSCWLIMVLLVFPIMIGYANSMRVYYENHDFNALSNTFSFAFTNYTHVMLTTLLMAVKIALWSLLLIIPGIIKSFAYAMTPYIIVEHPEYSASEAISKSEKMMRGHKGELFMLMLSFLGWYILCLLTLGIGFFWLEPYVQCAIAAFYNDLKGGDGNPVILQD